LRSSNGVWYHDGSIESGGNDDGDSDVGVLVAVVSMLAVTGTGIRPDDPPGLNWNVRNSVRPIDTGWSSPVS
jgi:hypothetical protein